MVYAVVDAFTLHAFAVCKRFVIRIAIRAVVVIMFDCVIVGFVVVVAFVTVVIIRVGGNGGCVAVTG